MTRKISKRDANKLVRKWNNIKAGDTYIVPYVIDGSIGNLMFCFKAFIELTPQFGMNQKINSVFALKLK